MLTYYVKCRKILKIYSQKFSNKNDILIIQLKCPVCGS